MAFVSKICLGIVISQVTALNWKEKCKSDRESCTTYCQEYPQFCDAICEADSSFDWCVPSATPPPKCENPVCNCDDNTPECMACKVCETPQKWCFRNRKHPGCEAICCDEGCSGDCGMEIVGSIDVKRTCKWRVLDQKHKAFRPVLLEANVEKHCPFADNYGIHLETCRHCAAQHAPCNDTYMACGGCCGTPWHDYLNLGINTYHTCDEIKSYFKLKNSIPIDCEEETPDNVGEPIGQVEIDLITPPNSTVVDEGKLQSNCSTPIKQLTCKRIPVKMRFECDDCGNKGTADLLNKCCDKCMAWAKSVEAGGHSGIPANIRPFIWCSGCNATKIVPLDPKLKANPLLHFPWTGANKELARNKYKNYTEKAADDGIEGFIEDQVCSLLAPNCSAKSTTTTKAPGFLTSTTSTSQPEEEEECLAGEGGTCAAWDHPEIIDDGRRLSQAEPVETPEFEMRSQKLVCPQIDTKFYEFAVEMQPNATKDPEVAAVIAGNKAFEGMKLEQDNLQAEPQGAGTESQGAETESQGADESQGAGTKSQGLGTGLQDAGESAKTSKGQSEAGPEHTAVGGTPPSAVAALATFVTAAAVHLGF